MSIRTFIKLLSTILFAINVQAAEIVRYVNTGSDGVGCDGTTNGTTGAGCAWQSIEDALTGDAQNLDTGNNIYHLYLEGSEDAVGGNITFAGWTTSATDYIILEVLPENQHPGYFSTSHYRITDASANANTFAPGQAVHLKVIGVQFEKTPTGTTRSIWRHYSYTDTWVFDKCIFKGAGEQTDMYGLRVTASGPDVWVHNSLFTGFSTANSQGIYIFTNTPDLYVVNNTFIGNTLGINVGTNTRLVNNIFQSNTDGLSGTATYEDYNISDVESDVAGGGSYTGSVSFVGGGDYHIADAACGSTCVNMGLDVENVQPTWWAGSAYDDVDGDTRDTYWTIGYDQYVGAEPTPTPTPTPEAGNGKKNLLLLGVGG